MGGGSNIGETSDNPVEINVTAMVDVIFCLCIFFMCSFHFKQLEGSIDAWMLKEGNQPGPPIQLLLEEVRIFMRWDPLTGVTTRKVGRRLPVGSDAELLQTIRSLLADYVEAQKPNTPVVIDCTPDVPWHDVVHVLDLCKAEKWDKVEFAEPMESSGRSQSR